MVGDIWLLAAEVVRQVLVLNWLTAEPEMSFLKKKPIDTWVSHDSR